MRKGTALRVWYVIAAILVAIPSAMYAYRVHHECVQEAASLTASQFSAEVMDKVRDRYGDEAAERYAVGEEAFPSAANDVMLTYAFAPYFWPPAVFIFWLAVGWFLFGWLWMQPILWLQRRRTATP